MRPVKHHIGIYSGTFDPIHQGHVAFALEAMRACGLDSVALLPEAQPRNKPSVSTLDDRIALIKLAIAGEQRLSIFTPSSKQFNVVQTLPELISHFHGSTLTLLLGSDVLRTFSDGWDNLKILLSKVHLAVGLRAHDSAAFVDQTISDLERLYDIKIIYKIIDTPHKHVSSSNIRKTT